ncbi:MAG: beta-lactamase class [Streptomyces sp.]|nr:beta-lactamase class [Streptomyces sp.]
MTDADIAEIFEQAGCEGALCVQSLDDAAEFGLRADERVVPASVVKVQIALDGWRRRAVGWRAWFAMRSA